MHIHTHGKAISCERRRASVPLDHCNGQLPNCMAFNCPEPKHTSCNTLTFQQCSCMASSAFLVYWCLADAHVLSECRAHQRTQLRGPLGDIRRLHSVRERGQQRVRIHLHSPHAPCPPLLLQQRGLRRLGARPFFKPDKQNPVKLDSRMKSYRVILTYLCQFLAVCSVKKRLPIKKLLARTWGRECSTASVVTRHAQRNMCTLTCQFANVMQADNPAIYIFLKSKAASLAEW